jgi:hypothetical protein
MTLTGLWWLRFDLDQPRALSLRLMQVKARRVPITQSRGS